MPSSVGPNTFGEENLVFGYDLGDTVNSYRGEPTINRAYLHNARIDNSYTALDLSGYQGALESLHPEPLTVYNQSGGNISTYFNTGINISNSGVDWYNTNHAYWVYDEILKKPATQIIDRNGVWQAKYMGLGITWDDMGMAPGDQYTISWLQWNNDGVKRPNVGVYWNSGGSNNFWDGTRDVGASPAGVWTRKSYTWTLGNYDTNTSLTLYMYGHYYSRATLRIADVQIEKKDHASQFSFGYERSATQGLIDLKSTSTIDLSNVSFDANAQMTFDGTDDIIQIPSAPWNILQTFTLEAVFNPIGNVGAGYHVMFQKEGGFSGGAVYGLRASNQGSGNIFAMICYDAQSVNAFTLDSTTPTVNGQTYHVVSTFDSSYNWKIYVNGVLQNSTTLTNLPFQNTSSISVGRGDGRTMNGYLPISKIYNRVLTAEEIRSNFNAVKGRFGI